MGMIDRIAALAGYEKRAADSSWAALAPNVGIMSSISSRKAENLSTVLACVNAIGDALGYVPALIYRRDQDGNRTEVNSHPLARLVHAGVNGGMAWPDYISHWLASTLLTGNGLAEIQRGAGGTITGLRFIPWTWVTVVELRSGRLAFDVSDGRGRSWRLLDGEVLYLRDRTDDGLVGRSRLSRAHRTVEGVHAANEFATAFLENGAGPSGVLKATGHLNPEQIKSLRESFERRFQGARKAGNTMILEGGLDWQAAQISPEDAELLETRKFGVIEICRLFQVPPPIVQAYENNTFTNAAQAGLWFATFCLAPWARKIEAEFARSLFPADSGLELELDLSGFLRGDPQTRWAAHKIAIETGVLDPDEVRQVEGWNRRVVA